MIFDDDRDDDRERSRRQWNDYLRSIDAEIREERLAAAATPTPKPEPAPLTIKPGSQHARAAEAEGRGDEYSNRMKARYGGEW